jgi:hypothetical protein
MSNIIKLFAGLFTGSFLVASCGMIYYNQGLVESKNLKTITSEQPKEVSERLKHERQENDKRNEIRKQEEIKNLNLGMNPLNTNDIELFVGYFLEYNKKISNDEISKDAFQYHYRSYGNKPQVFSGVVYKIRSFLNDGKHNFILDKWISINLYVKKERLLDSWDDELKCMNLHTNVRIISKEMQKTSLTLKQLNNKQVEFIIKIKNFNDKTLIASECYIGEIF